MKALESGALVGYTVNAGDGPTVGSASSTRGVFPASDFSAVGYRVGCIGGKVGVSASVGAALAIAFNSNLASEVDDWVGNEVSVAVAGAAAGLRLSNSAKNSFPESSFVKKRPMPQ